MEEHTRQTILELISAYAHGYDTPDWALFSTLWHSDAVVLFQPGGVVAAEMRSSGAIIEGMKARRGRLQDDGVQPRHFQTNSLVTSDGDGVAVARTTFIVTWQRAHEPAPSIRFTGVYRDQFTDGPDGWRFARREIISDQS